jgi:hypothetical protein
MLQVEVRLVSLHLYIGGTKGQKEPLYGQKLPIGKNDFL